MSKEPYNWWTDPKNKEEVERLSWWDKPENQGTIEIPVSIIESDGYWVIAANDKTEELLGKGATVQGKTKEEAIKKFFSMLRFMHEITYDSQLNYQRFVPIRKGDWKEKGGRWIVIFGHHFYFRYGKRNQYGWFVPFTALNISYHNEWKTYRKWKETLKNRKKNDNTNS